MFINLMKYMTKHPNNKAWQKVILSQSTKINVEYIGLKCVFFFRKQVAC